MIPRKPIKNGEYGDLTKEALFLFGKSDEYRRGYRAGKLKRATKSENYVASVAANFQNAEYLEGFTKGRKVQKHGIQKTLGKVKK
ncbi:hypothetical protein ACT3R5_16070 [Glutamicibacter sp. AOP5-A2-7]